MNKQLLNIVLMTETAKVPTYAHETDGCFDLYVDWFEEPGLSNGQKAFNLCFEHERIIAHTSIKLAVPPGYMLDILSRSGHGFNNSVRLVNCLGLIDEGYTGEIMVGLIKDSESGDLFLKQGDRIAQGRLIPKVPVEFNVVDSLEATERGEGGFGSTNEPDEEQDSEADFSERINIAADFLSRYNINFVTPEFLLEIFAYRINLIPVPTDKEFTETLQYHENNYGLKLGDKVDYNGTTGLYFPIDCGELNCIIVPAPDRRSIYISGRNVKKID